MGEAKRRELIMVEETKKIEEALDSKPEEQKFIAKLEIMMMLDGNFSVRGPIGNKALCKALLSGGEQCIDDAKLGPQIIPANFIPKIQGRG